MKIVSSPRLVLLGALACCAVATPRFALAQPEAPVAADAPAAKAKKGNKGVKPKRGKKARGKKLMPRVIAATETAMGKPLTPEQQEQLTTAMRERDAAVKTANDAYYAAFAGATGLTTEQAQKIDKPARGAKAVKAPTEPGVEGQTDRENLTETDETGGAPVTPK